MTTGLLTQEMADEILRLVDERLAQAGGATETHYRERYGVVEAITATTCSVVLLGGTKADVGYAYPSWMALSVGDRVRVRENSRGDRYVDQNYTQGPGFDGTFDGEIVSARSTATGGQFRAIGGATPAGFFIRNDGANVYFMLTDAGDPLGTWNAFRPLRINLTTGEVTLDLVDASVPAVALQGTPYGRSFLAVADVAAGQALLGIQSVRVTAGLVSMPTLTSLEVTVTWPVAFADTNYTVVATMEGGGSQYNAKVGLAIKIKTAGGCTIGLFNHHTSALVPLAVHVIAIHD